MAILAHTPHPHGPDDEAPGILLHDAARYDAFVWLLTLGRESAFRNRILRLAALLPGESVLDVGCGTGTLAIGAKRRVGDGVVCGIDASAAMIERARRKAQRAGLKLDFGEARAQALPFPDGRFDIVMTSLVLHHLPAEARRDCVQEMARVVRPGGRVLAVDFAAPPPGRKSLMDHLHRHGHVEMTDVASALKDAGLTVVEDGDAGYRNLKYAVALRG